MSSLEIEKLSPDYIIYSNIQSFAECRGKKIVGGGFDGKESTYPLSEIDFNKKNKASHYLVIVANDLLSGKENDTTIVLISSGSDYYKKDKLNAILSKVRTDNIIVIKPEKDKVKAEDVEVVDGDIYLIRNWSECNREKGRSFRIITAEEWDNGVMHNQFYVDIPELPPIRSTACEVVWSGAKVGSILELTSPSLSSNGFTSSYYRII